MKRLYRIPGVDWLLAEQEQFRSAITLRFRDLDGLPQDNTFGPLNTPYLTDVGVLGPSPLIILLASSRHVNVFMFNLADMSVLYCPQPLVSGRFQSSTLLGSTPSPGTALVDWLVVEPGVAVVGGLFVLDMVWELVCF